MTATDVETEQTEQTGDQTEQTEPAAPAGDQTDQTEQAESADQGRQDDRAKLRTEAARYRTELRDTEQQLDQTKRELYRARVAATGRLADPDDLPYDADADADQIDGAITDLLARKPHMAARRPASGNGIDTAGRDDRGAPAPNLLARMQQRT